jgi:hypothetical protein
MSDQTTGRPDARLTFLRDELAASVDVAGDISPVGDRWAVHGTIPLEGEVILGEFDTYEQAHDALALLGPSAAVPVAPVRSRIGHSDGWLVLQFERRLGQLATDVWQALGSSEHREHGVPCGLSPELPLDLDPPMAFEWCPGPDTVRWTVDPLAVGSRLELTTWIDSDDPDVAAGTGAGYHRCFEELVRLLDGDAVPCSDLPTLTRRYLDAFSAALADTD